MKHKEKRIQYEINRNGCPIVEALDNSYVSVGVNEQVDVVEIFGNRNGLISSGKWLIALADEDAVLDHQHFDHDVNFNCFKEENNIKLIVSRVGK